MDSVLGLDPFLADFDRLSQRLLGSVEAVRGAGAAMPMEVLRRGDHLVVRLDLPGVPGDKVDVTVDGRTLTIEATREPDEQEGDVVFVRSRLYGTMRRQLTLPDVLDVDRIEARFDDGVLSLRVPMAEHAKPRRIELQRGRAGTETGAETGIESGAEGAKARQIIG
ncbi:MAG: Hsp20/alpha crystallin family protein [Frankiaceae bacterium]